MALKKGTIAPNFILKSTSGKDFNLIEDQKGKPCIIYFYPKDFTPGCTKEACEFREHYHEFKDLDIDVFGISQDSYEKHIKFKDKHQLPFDLLADLSSDVAKKYDALIPIIGMTKRITYLLNKELRIIAVYDSLFGYSAHIKKMISEISDL